jgi:hypothetical protein
VGFVPAGYGIPVWLLLPVGIAVLVLIVRVLGKRAQDLDKALA